jgi:hypothetical protein
MVKDILIVADLGAAGNLLRNLLLLGNTDWPLSTDKIKTILNQYPVNLQLKNWLQVEYKLRFWSRYYGLDLSDQLDFKNYQTLPPTLYPRVWLNHSAFWEKDQIKSFLHKCCVVYVAPSTSRGLEWQIRSYVTKKTKELLHDFCFTDNREIQIKKYIKDYGIDAYYLYNIENMKCIIEKRQIDMKKIISSTQCIDLETLLFGKSDEIRDMIQQATELSIPTEQIEKVVSAWRKLHWDDTTTWEYHKIFQQ